MECISVFDMLKIGVGPSSSHTLGPWRAAELWLAELKEKELFPAVTSVAVYLYGSLSLTGKGHATDTAVMMGLLGKDPETVPTETIPDLVSTIATQNQLNFAGSHFIPFNIENDIVFKKEFLPFHANGIQFLANLKDGGSFMETYYSIGGGFVVKEGQESKDKEAVFL